MSKIRKKKSFGFGKKKSAPIPIPILSADTVTNTEFWSHTSRFRIQDWLLRCDEQDVRR